MKTIYTKVTKPSMGELERKVLTELKQNNGKIELVLRGLRSTRAEFFSNLYHTHNVISVFEFGNSYILELMDSTHK